MEVVCLPSLTKEQKAQLPEDYVAPPIEGMYEIDEAHPDGIIFIYLEGCDWQNRFEQCLKEFVLAVFHEVMHVLCPDMSDHVPYAERILAELLDKDWQQSRKLQC